METPQEVLTGTLARFEDAYFDMVGKEEELRIAKEYFKSIAENDLPEAMDAAEVLTAITPGAQMTVKVAPQVNVNVTKKEMPEACDWFMQNGCGDLVKRDFTVSFGAKEHEAATKFYADLVRLATEAKKEVFIEKTVHGKTLKSFVTKALTTGKLEKLPSFIATFIPRFASIVMDGKPEE